MAECIFCGGKPVSREHVFARKWLAKVMPSDADFRHADFRETEEGEGFERWWTKHEADFVVRCVCSKCNNNWMNQLDNQADFLLTPATRGQRVPLVSFTHQALIAAWICKVAMLADHVKPKQRVTPEDHRYFYEHWQPPKGWWIWVAGGRELPGQYEAWVTSRNIRGRASDGSVSDGYMATMLVNHFVAQAVVLPFREISQPDRKDNLPLLRQVWPPTYDTVEWPPPRALRRADLDAFSRSFTNE